MFNGGEKGKGERGKMKLLFPHVAEGGNNMVAKFEMKMYITPQESRRGDNKWGEGNDRREEGRANGRRELLEINTFKKGQGQLRGKK